MAQKKRNPSEKISHVNYSKNGFESQVFTKEELKENEIIENAIHENYRKSRKIYKQNTFLDYLLLFLGASVFLFGLMFLIAVIEGLRF